MTIEEAINYFKQADYYGFATPSAQELSEMTEEEIITLAEKLGERFDYLAQN